jgi:transposase IS66 family protein
MMMIGELYAIEAEIRGQAAELRQQVRLARAGPKLAELYHWLIATVRQLSKKSDLARAIHYALTRGAITVLGVHRSNAIFDRLGESLLYIVGTDMEMIVDSNSTCRDRTVTFVAATVSNLSYLIDRETATVGVQCIDLYR